jgi:hypothetical protein
MMIVPSSGEQILPGRRSWVSHLWVYHSPLVLLKSKYRYGVEDQLPQMSGMLLFLKGNLREISGINYSA